MTDEMMTLRSLLEKSSDTDSLREMSGFTAQRLMALEMGAAKTHHQFPVTQPFGPEMHDRAFCRPWRMLPEKAHPEYQARNHCHHAPDEWKENARLLGKEFGGLCVRLEVEKIA